MKLLPPPAVMWSQPCLTCKGKGYLALNHFRLPRECPTCRGAGKTIHTPLTDPRAGVPAK